MATMAVMRPLVGAVGERRCALDDRFARACTKKMIELDRVGLSTDHEGDIANGMRLSRYESAIRRWVNALDGRGDRVRVEAAVHPEVRVARFGFGASSGQLVQSIQGTSEVTDWVGLTPAAVQFDVVGSVGFEAEEPGESSGSSGETNVVATVRYQVTTVGFAGGGTWRFRLADDDRILWLEHRPDDLPDANAEDGSRTGSMREHRHDHPHHVEHHH